MYSAKRGLLGTIRKRSLASLASRSIATSIRSRDKFSALLDASSDAIISLFHGKSEKYTDHDRLWYIKNTLYSLHTLTRVTSSGRENGFTR